MRYERAPVHRDFRAGDVRHSQADVSKARRLLGYEPRVTMKEEGLAMPWRGSGPFPRMTLCL